MTEQFEPEKEKTGAGEWEGDPSVLEDDTEFWKSVEYIIGAPSEPVIKFENNPLGIDE